MSWPPLDPSGPPPENLTQEITFFNIVQKKAFKQTRYVVFSRIIKSEQIIVRGRVGAHFKAMVILYLENKDSLL